MELTLVIMAAGIGSRFGGPKQTTPVDEDGNFIIDYSIYDAILAGFTKVVFIIRKESLALFQETIGKRLEGKIKVCYAFQRLEDIPRDIPLEKREKPWGTAHALMAAKPYVQGPFVLINADDFYGRNAYFEAARFLKEESQPYTYALFSFSYSVTKSLIGSVKRGIIETKDEKVVSICECEISSINDKNIAKLVEDGKCFEISDNTPVSMNFFAFQTDVFPLLQEYISSYFLQKEKEILEGEILLPACLKENIESKKIIVLHKLSHSLWLGMTYKEDLHIVKTNIKYLKDIEKIYPYHLWEGHCEKK